VTVNGDCCIRAGVLPGENEVVAQFESQNVATLDSLNDYCGIGSNRRLS
jgi:hypothetical protein